MGWFHDPTCAASILGGDIRRTQGDAARSIPTGHADYPPKGDGETTAQIPGLRHGHGRVEQQDNKAGL